MCGGGGDNGSSYWSRNIFLVRKGIWLTNLVSIFTSRGWIKGLVRVQGGSGCPVGLRCRVRSRGWFSAGQDSNGQLIMLCILILILLMELKLGDS